VRARASATSAATRREVEQSITRFEKRLDDANDALQALGKNLGRGAQSSYKEVTAAMRALRRDASKTNKQALKDFDKLRQAVATKASPSKPAKTRSSSRSTSGTARSTARTTSRSTTSRAAGSRTTASKSRSTASKSRSTASKPRSTSSRSGGTRSTSSRAKKS
jgi:hypothetical protein